MITYYFGIGILGAFLVTAGSAPSNLQLISEDFRILSRVTNAISLQAGAIRKNIKVRDLLVELIRMPRDQFNNIIDVDIKVARTELNRMGEEFEKLSLLLQNDTNSLVGDNMTDLKNNLKFLSLFSQQTSTFLDAIKYPIKNLMNNLTTIIANNSMFRSSCSQVDTDNFKSFWDSINNELSEYATNDFPGFADTFVANKPNFSDCLNYFPQLQAELDALPIWGGLEMIRKWEDIIRLVAKFDALSDSLRATNATLFRVLSSLKATKSLWKSVHPNYHAQVMTQLNRSLFEIIKHHIAPTKPVLKYSAGFRSSRDFSKISKDLSSPWFRRNIAKESKTKDLNHALKIFHDISEAVTSLDTSWHNFTALTLDFESSEVAKAGPILDVISKMSLNFANYESIIQNASNKLSECFSNFSVTSLETPNSSLQEMIQDFQQAISPATNYMKYLAQIRKQVSYININSILTIRPNRTIKSFFDEYYKKLSNEIEKQKVNKTNSLRVKTRLKIIIDQIDKREVDFHNFMTHLSQNLKNIKVITNKSLPNDTKIDKLLVEMLDTSQLRGISKCLSQEFMQPLRVLEVIEAMITVRQFAGNKTVLKMNQYLDELAKVKNQLWKVEKQIKLITSQSNSSHNLVLKLKTPELFTASLGTCAHVLEDLEEARQNHQLLSNYPDFPVQVLKTISGMGLREWLDPEQKLQVMLQKIDALDAKSKMLRKNGNLSEMVKVFDDASKINGIRGDPKDLYRLFRLLKKSSKLEKQEAAKYFESIKNLDLDFARHEAILKGAEITISSLMTYFDEIFGNKKLDIVTIAVDNQLSWIYIIIICIGVMILIGLICIVAYGFTQNGRSKYTNLYLYYVGKPVHYENRWRYSLFLDNQDGKNTLLDAVREINKTNAVNAVKAGSYINAFNKFGNTALHTATKSALPEIVKLLIKNGADRELLNTMNRTPEQMIPLVYKDIPKDKVENFDKIRALYKKANGKKHKMNVPQKFPTTSFHIWIDERTDINITNQFMEKFQAITSDEANSNTTHVIVKTDENGALETDSLDLLLWVFNGAIIVKEQWMVDCLENETVIEQDSKYLVEKVKYKGSYYNTVLQWSEAMAKGAIPYLYGVYSAVVMVECKNLLKLNSLVAIHGGVMMEVFPRKELFNVGSHPYNHANLGPLFLIHDGKINLSVYKSDPDKMYTLFTEEEFIKFMLKRDIVKDISETPISVLKDEK